MGTRESAEKRKKSRGWDEDRVIEEGLMLAVQFSNTTNWQYLRAPLKPRLRA